MLIRASLASLLFLVAAPLTAAPALGDLSKVGKVHFPTSCRAEVQPEFERAVALLHSFFYGEARRVFTTVAERDPSCAMAHWGVAMTWFHPLWAPPTAEEMQAGLAAVEKAEAAQAKTARERDYIAAVATLYRAPADDSGAMTESCHGTAASTVRRDDYIAALERLHKKYPKDPEAAAFYALSVLKSNPLPTDIPVHRKAAAILDKLWAKNRDHPGVVHYLIHAYDYPALARQGLPAANHYTKIAPWVPHALHMPSHIYTRLGMWQESLASNAASAEAARAYGEKHHPGTAYFEELHALDYLVYAHLQKGEDAQAQAIVERVARIEETYPKVDAVIAYAAGAIPARYALERRRWQEAADLDRPPAHVVEKFPFNAAHVEFARAIGLARLGELRPARKALGRMEELARKTTDPRFTYFKRQLEVQQLAVRGWLAWAEGRGDEAIALLRYAAEEDDLLGKNPISPGNILPVRELLADLLLELKRPDQALTAFEASLQLNPGRFNAVRGAAQAAQAAGRQDVARRYYADLLALAGQSQRPELAEARAFLGQQSVAQAAP